MNTPSNIPTTITELIALHTQAGGYWFSEGAMRFFRSRIETDLINGRYFVSSEELPDGSRMFSVRTFDDEFNIEDVGEPFIYATREAAITGLIHATVKAIAA